MTRMALGDFDSPRRLLGATSLLVIGVVLGSTIYYRLGEGRWDFWDCVYMTVITLSTVGFAETLPGIALVPYARLFTVILIVIGSGVLLYVASNLTAIFVEGDLRGLLRRRRMQREIDAMKGHIIVCGVGSHGEHVVEELASMVIN
ncbi:MAG: potassium channel family protein, partial [Myxococcota bacterium]